MNWEDFLAFVAPFDKEDLPVERLVDLVGQLEFTAELVDPHKKFCADKYARNLIIKNHLFEAVCMCWEPGQHTVVHNHGDSFGVFYVYEGELFFNAYDRVDDRNRPGMAELTLSSKDRSRLGAVHFARKGDIHEMGNHPEHHGRTVSIHFYAGPMEQLEVFDVAKNTVESVVLPYFTAPEDRAGAALVPNPKERSLA